MKKKLQKIYCLIILAIIMASNGYSQYLLPEYIANVDSTKPLIYVDQFNGSYQQYDRIGQRDSIPFLKRAIGMMVTVNDSTMRYDGPDTTYTNWINPLNWTLFTPTKWVEDGNYLHPITITDSVGIGTNSPTKLLEVNGSSLFNDTIYLSDYVNINSPSGKYFYINATKGIYLYSSASSHLNLNNIGITSYLANNDVWNIGGLGQIEYTHDNSSYSGILQFPSVSANRQWDLQNKSGTIALTSDISNSILWGETDGHIYPKTLTDSVGIGTTTPSSLFEVKDLVSFKKDNTLLGYRAGASLKSGIKNVFLGYEAGYYETDSNKLYIANSNTTTPLIYGEFDNNYLNINGHLNVTDSLGINSEYVSGFTYLDSITSNIGNVVTGVPNAYLDTISASYLILNNDSISYRKGVAKFHRIDSLNTSSANTWITVKMDTVVGDESTYGFKFNSDSSAIICTRAGIIQVGGCVHYYFYGGSTTLAKLYTRVLIDGQEARCLQTNTDKNRFANATGYQNYIGSVTANEGSTIQLQIQVDNTDLDLQGAAVFDHPVAATIWFNYLSK